MSKQTNRVIGIRIDGDLEWHAINPGPTDHETLCGIDANDESLGHLGTVPPPRGQKIDCSICRAFFDGWRELSLRKSDFE